MLLLISYEEDVINSTNSLDGNGNQLVGTCSVESRGRSANERLGARACD